VPAPPLELTQVYREEWGRVLAPLVRLTRDLDLAEDALQEAWARGLSAWSRDGLPDRPGAWLLVAARRIAIDRLRRRSRDVTDEDVEPEPAPPPELPEDVPDERLRLAFGACHPALSRPAQVGLTLRTLCGLTTAEIARAFLEPEATTAQRLARAKRKILEEGIRWEVPSREDLPERLDAVLAVVYLVFNEGYLAAAGDALIRRDLCAEALRLARMLAALLPDEPEVLGLLSLVLLQDARRDARSGPDGELVPLEEQDRSRWDRREIGEGTRILGRALAVGRHGPYQLQAAIAALHDGAPTAADTDWRQIALLYGALSRAAPSPAVSLAEAVAVAMAEGPEEGLRRLERLEASGELASYHLLPATRADLLRRLGRASEAAESYRAALASCTNERERGYLARRLREVTSAARTST
jgi:RNA polymerase sigma-70 factor, ECF subfamily